MARLLEQYQREIIPELSRTFGFSNKLRIPRLVKIVVNMGVGQGSSDDKAIQGAVNDLALITGQRPVITQAKKSIAGFKLRKGMKVGCRVTLRGKMMYEFLDRLINVALPRIRDFRGLPSSSFDGHGNYSLGVEEQIIFPEVDIDKVYRIQGMNITIVTNTNSDEEAKGLLTLVGMPFQR